MPKFLVTINLVVLNGEKYVRRCLDAVLMQTYPHELIEFNILDNNSTDNTKEIIKNFGFRISDFGFAKFFLLESEKNLGVWPGQEELLKHTNGKYIVALCVDVLMDKDFIKNAVETMEEDEKMGALQPKIYRFELGIMNNESRGENHNSLFTVHYSRIIDTAGFKIFRSRRVVNIGHGESDFAETLTGKENNKFDFSKQQEIFAVEGAAPIFRKEALESCRIQVPSSKFQVPSSEIADHEYFWYGDDLDIAWRMRLFGWKEVFAPTIVAWHDRQTTKTLKKSWMDYIARIPVRRQIQIRKRRLDWRNIRWTLVKNDYMIDILKDLPWIISREIAVLGYAVLFEPGVLKEIPTFFRYLPKMLRKRKEIMKKAIVGPKEMRKWIN